MAVTALARKSRPTNADIVAAVGELHDCLHAVDKKIDGVQIDLSDVKQRVAKVEGFQAGIATKLRVHDPDSRPGFLKRHKTPIATFGAVLGAISAFAAAYPVIRGAVMAMDAYLTAGQ